MKQYPYEVCSDWLIVIETNSYAGNFERPMVSWCTGANSESHGYHEALLFLDKYRDDEWALNLCEKVGRYANDECASLWPTKKKSTDGLKSNLTGVAIPWSERPTHREMKFILDRALDYAEHVRLRKFEGTHSISQFVTPDLKVFGAIAVRLRLSQTITSRVGIKREKKYQRSKKNPRPSLG